MIEFTPSAPLSLGVEEELLILDAETFAPVGAVEVLVRESEERSLPGRLKTELHASVVELNTDVCATVADAVAALAELREAARAIAHGHGLVLAGAGTHPLARPEDLPVVQERRYLEMIETVGPAARRQGVSGLHVHVGVRSADECWRALAGVVPWLPLVLALSANSPYLAGAETGLASSRAPILAELPRAGAPPPFATYGDWVEWVDRLSRAGVMADYTRLWWDVRPHPRFGTLEIRVPDQPTALARTASLVAVLQALVAVALEAAPRAYDAAALGDYGQNRAAAARSGLEAELIAPGADGAVPARELATELRALLDPALRALASDAYVDLGEPEATRQLAVGRTRGLEAVCADLVERSLASA